MPPPPHPVMPLGLMENIKREHIERTSQEPASSKKARRSHTQRSTVLFSAVG